MARHFILRVPSDPRCKSDECDSYTLEIDRKENGKTLRFWKGADTTTQIASPETLQLLESVLLNPKEVLRYDAIAPTPNQASKKFRLLREQFNDENGHSRIFDTVPAHQGLNGGYRLKDICQVDVFPGLRCDARKTRTRIFATATANLRLPLRVFLHTVVMMHKRGTHDFREVASISDAREAEIRFDDLTGVGEASALLLLDQYCHKIDVELEKPPLEARKFDVDVFRDRSVIWLGSPFNECHDLIGELRDQSLWSANMECAFESCSEGLKVSWPGNSQVVNNKDTEGVSYALLRHVRFGEHASLLIAAGTNTEATLFAVTVLTGYRKDGQPSDQFDGYLEQAAAQNPGEFEVLFKRTNRLVKKIWPPCTSALAPNSSPAQSEATQIPPSR